MQGRTLRLIDRRIRCSLSFGAPVCKFVWRCSSPAESFIKPELRQVRSRERREEVP